jgi:hypothetical protein
MATVHVVPEAESQPVQPVKVDPVAAEAVSVTLDNETKDAAQELPQSILAGDDVTVPKPVPLFDRLSK